MNIRVKITRFSNPDRGKIITLDLEEYLRDVIPSEIKAGSCPMQAQCAQAIAARTYAYNRILSSKSRDYDVDDTSLYQAYKARPRHANSDKAVAVTKDLVVMYEGKPIDAQYTHCNGGKTVSAKDRTPYLIGVTDKYDDSENMIGHGRGMSQLGAEKRAKAGMLFGDILAFYYPSTSICKISNKEDSHVSINYDEKLSPHFTVREFFDPTKYLDVKNPKTNKKYTLDEAEDVLGGNVIVSSKLVELLEGIREEVRKTYPNATITVNPHGGYRPPVLNAAVGGASGSQHKYGRAADFSVNIGNGKKMDAPTLAVLTEKYMAEHGFKGGVGMYKASHTYIHVDVRGSKTQWYDSYSSAGCPGQGGVPCVYKKNQKGAGVALIQRKLTELGFFRFNCDGKYGSKTVLAVQRFQEANGLKPDGVYGKDTNDKLKALPW